MGNEVKAWVSTIEEQNASWRNKGQERLCLFSFRTMDTDHAPGDGKAPEDIIGSGHQALGVMSSSFILKAALGIELLSNLPGCGKVVFGAIKGHNSHPLPDMVGIARVEAVGQLHGFLQDVPENSPGNLSSSLCEAAFVDFTGIGPQPTATGRPEEVPGFDVHSLALATGYKGENEGDELGKGQFPIACEILGCFFELRVDFLGDEVEKS